MKDNALQSQKGSNAVANQVTQRKSTGRTMPSAKPIQRMAEEEEEPMQMKKDPVQRAAEEEDESLQG